MKYFFESAETIDEGLGFSHYDGLHLSWLALFLVATVLNCIWYRKMDVSRRSRWKKTMAVMMIVMEIIKNVVRLICGTFVLEDLPFHLCGINIFVIAIHAWKPKKTLSNFLYMACIPGAMAALLFPDWASLPLLNFMHLHSFIVHILLAMYPIVTASCGELAPSVKELPKSFLLLLCMAIAMYGVNLLCDTNFMFLMYADEGNPLLIFENLWGNHLYGFPVLLSAVLIVMYVPLVIFRKIKKRPI